MKKQILFFIIAIGSIGFACSDESQLQRSIFIEDSNNPGLPRYSELGYNTFGAYYDRQVFKSSEIVPVKVLVTGGQTSFVLSGQIGYYNEMSITLTIDNSTPAQFDDLISLNDTTLDLTGANYTVLIRKDFVDEQATILNGTFHFKRAQNLLVDTELTEIILSGTFEFQALVNGLPITVSNGRFDVGVGPDNFYSF